MTITHTSGAGMRRPWPAARSTAAIVAFGLVPGIALAQTDGRPEPLKPASITTPPRPVCSAVKPTALPTADQRRRARDLAQRGQQAAILGDTPAALRDLRDASLLDPTDADLAYQLARAYETTKDAANAASEYCRFLALSPTAPEVGEVVEKVRILAPPRTDPATDSALAAFRSGAAAYERGDFAVAEAAFSRAIRFDSTWADAYFNRAQARLSRSERASARADLERYLAFKPGAGDRPAVATQIAALNRPTYSAFRALALGTVVPGAGQFYTRRPIRGLFTMVAVGGAIGYGLLETSTARSVQETATDPFGQPYTFTTTRVTRERTNLTTGAIAAGSIAALSALDAAIFAHSSSTRARRMALSVIPSAGALVARVALFTP